MPLLGSPVRRVEDARFLVGASQYVADLDLPSVLDVTYVTATVAHAVIRAIDVTAARSAPGRGRRGDRGRRGPRAAAPLNPDYPEAMRRPLLATGRVRFVGEAGGGDRGGDGRAPAPTPPPWWRSTTSRFRPSSIPRRPGGTSVLLFPDAGSNLVLRQEGGVSEPEPATSGDVVVRGRFVNQRVAPAPLEGRAGARPLGRGRPSDPLVVLPGGPPGPGGHRRPVRPRSRRHPGHRPGRRRQLRGQGPPVPGGAAAAVAGPAGRRPGAMGPTSIGRHGRTRATPAPRSRRWRSPATGTGRSVR